jgi:hypothetical protein
MWLPSSVHCWDKFCRVGIEVTVTVTAAISLMVVADNDGDKGGELICHKGDASAQEFMRRRWLDEQICTERALESF